MMAIPITLKNLYLNLQNVLLVDFVQDRLLQRESLVTTEFLLGYFLDNFSDD